MKTETSLLVVRDGEEESRKVTRLRKCHEREPGRVGLKSVSGRQASLHEDSDSSKHLGH